MQDFCQCWDKRDGSHHQTQICLNYLHISASNGLGVQGLTALFPISTGLSFPPDPLQLRASPSPVQNIRGFLTTVAKRLEYITLTNYLHPVLSLTFWSRNFTFKF